MVENFSAASARCSLERASAVVRASVSQAVFPVGAAIRPDDGNRVAELPADVLHGLRESREAQLGEGVDLVPIAGQGGLLREQIGVLHLGSVHDHAIGLVIRPVIGLEKDGKGIAPGADLRRQPEKARHLDVVPGNPRQDAAAVGTFPPEG